jgi:hypothetical protein
MEIAVEKFGAGYRAVGIRTWMRSYGPISFREFELKVWDRIVYISIRR